MLAMATTVLGTTGMIPTIGTTVNDKVGNIGAKALGYVQWFGYALAIGMIIYLGIKYMMASANEKADLKKGAINYVIGAILVAGATAIVTVLSSIGKDITAA